MKGGGGQHSDANDTAILWVPIVCIVLGVLAWFLFKPQIIRFSFMLKGYELSFMSLILTPISNFLALLHLPHPNMVKVRMMRNLMFHPDPAALNVTSFMAGLYYVGSLFRYFAAICLILMAAALFIVPSSGRFRKCYSMNSFRKAESGHWPQITPVLSADLVKQDINEGPWAMAMNPLGFCFKNQIIDEEEVKRTGQLVVAQGIAHNTFVMQLGAPFRGIRNCPIHVRALFAIFASAASYDRDTMDSLQRQIAASAGGSGKLNFAGVDKLVDKYENADFAQWLNPRHAYVTTWMASLLLLARNSGVVAMSEILWLKPVDRRLWYILNNIGRSTAFCEVAGVYAHWLAEKKIGRALKTPMIKQAVSALEEAMSEIAYTSEESKWQDSVV